MFATQLRPHFSRSRHRFRDPRAVHSVPASVATVSDDVPQIEAQDAGEFRRWLSTNHETSRAVWLVYWKKDSGHPSIEWSEAVDQALCFGWIDSKAQSVDENRFRQYFTVRKSGSIWSKINKDNVARLDAAGLMTPAGTAAVERAKADGSWTILDGPEAGVVPDDLADAMEEAGVRDTFDGLTAGRRKAILGWLVMAKREATRSERIEKTITALRSGEAPMG